MGGPSITPRDFPDWNRPATRIASTVVASRDDLIGANSLFFVSLAPDDVNDVLMLTGDIAAGIGFHVIPLLPGIANEVGRRLAYFPEPGGQMQLPVQHLGDGFDIEVFNFNGSDVTVGYDILTFSGANVDTVVDEAYVNAEQGLAIAGMTDLDPLLLDQAFLYDRATITITGDQPFTATLHRWSMSDDPNSMPVDYPSPLGSALANATLSVDVPLGCMGATVVISNTSITDGTFALVTRTYRPVGA